MHSILEKCLPRPEIVAGSFNPETFTLSLSPVIDFYRRGKSGIDNIYTDAQVFFRELTYPTQGLRLTLTEVFGRIAGDMGVPAIHRLETAFGGGKTHTLTACAHIAGRGSDLKDVTREIIDPSLLPASGSVSLVGVAGDEIPVHKPKGEALIPYTLWGEIAYQIGGESLYREVESDADSYAAPGRIYFERVFSERKVVIMLDELAQYAARLEAARPDGASQLAAFLMALHGYARNRPGIAIILTLAGAADAFARQTEKLAELISNVQGQQVGTGAALGIGEKAVKVIASVVARDAVQVTPVQAAEISAVLTKRLFLSVDREAAREAAEEYFSLYQRNSSLLPEEATNEAIKDRMTAHYPFHPTLVDFLNKKLAGAENFQGTRGVLRVLSLAVRNIWQKGQPLPMIHACHLDLRQVRVVDEILNRTGSSDLLPVLNADIGGVDTGTLEGAHSNAELADQKNRHPEGYPLYEYTWKTVFLHSLVGRSEGLESRVFGLTEAEALFNISFPCLTPPQVRTALGEIVKNAFYLRHEQGKYFAGTEPTINSILARIRRTVSSGQLSDLLQATARKLITGSSGLFQIEHDVSLPDHLPDGKSKPVLGVVSLTAESVSVETMVTTKGVNKPREQQNLIFLLVPETAATEQTTETLFTDRALVRQRVDDIARQVKAMRVLKERPNSFGVMPQRLEKDDFKNLQAEREQALLTAVSGLYNSLYYPSASGHIVRKEIKTATGEGGLPFIELIRETLVKDGELLTERTLAHTDLVSLSKLFFEHSDTAPLAKIRQNFYCLRHWPLPENAGVIDQILRSGVQKGVWCVYRMGEADQTRPAEFYHREQEIPFGMDLTKAGYSLITPQGALKRGWADSPQVDRSKVKDSIYGAVISGGTTTLSQIAETVAQAYGSVPDRDLEDAVTALIRDGRLIAYRGTPEQQDKPDLIRGAGAVVYTPQAADVLITPAKAAERGWITEKRQSLTLSGPSAADKILPLLRRIGGIYNRGAKSTIKDLDLAGLVLPAGGLLRLQLSDATPDTMKALGELFEVLDNLVSKGGQTEVFLEITEPGEDCLLVQEIKKQPHRG